MLCIVFLFGLPINIIILIGWRGFRGKLLGFHFIENVTVILKVDPTILKVCSCCCLKRQVSENKKKVPGHCTILQVYHFSVVVGYVVQIENLIHYTASVDIMWWEGDFYDNISRLFLIEFSLKVISREKIKALWDFVMLCTSAYTAKLLICSHCAVTGQWLCGDYSLTSTSGTSGRLQNHVSVPPWFLHSDCV